MRRISLLAAIFGLWVLAGTAVAAELNPKALKLDIRSQPIGDALNELARESGFQVVIDPADGIGIDSPRVTGTFTIEEALKAMLAHTGLVYEFLNPHTVAVRRPKVPGAASKSPDSEKDKLDEIIVTGTYIRGTAPIGSPVKVYSREDIQQSGSGTLDQFARQMLENFSATDSLSNGNSNSARSTTQAINGNNLFQGAGFNLHGLGVSATLTLLNGERLANAGLDGSFADISQIPLAAIDHIEVLSDGASAIYGSDAVGGVVNIITRRDFSGAETGLRYATATEGGDAERTVSQVLGKTWNGGSGLLTYEFDKQGGLLASDRDYIPDLGGPNSLIPENRRNSVFLSGKQDLSTSTSIQSDVLYSHRNFLFQSFQQNDLQTLRIESGGFAQQWSATLGINQSFLDDWTAGLTGNYSKSTQKSESAYSVPAAGSFSALDDTQANADTSVLEFDARAQGSIASLPAGALKISVGAGTRHEKFEAIQNTSSNGQVIYSVNQPTLGRHVSSVYGELAAPIFAPAQDIVGLRRLEVSLAFRYDKYSDFGSTTNPKLGFLWQPIDSVKVRGTFGTSYQAPLLSYVGYPLFIDAIPYIDTRSPSGLTNTLAIAGGNPNLGPQKSRSFTGGLEWRPLFVPGLGVSLDYFHIKFTDQVSNPPASGGGNYNLADPLLAPFIVRNPSLSTVTGYFNNPGFVDVGAGIGPADVGAIFDNRYANIAATRTSGLDLTTRYQFTVGPGQLGMTLGVERLLTNEVQSVAGAAFFPLLNTFGEPTKTKGRASVTWSQGGFTVSGFANYVNRYENSLFTPPHEIGSWLTADLYLGYKTSDSEPFLVRHLTISASVNNIADRRPPTIEIPSALLLPGQSVVPYDATNASPVGRLVSVSVNKQW